MIIKLALFCDLPQSETIMVWSSRGEQGGPRESHPFPHHRTVKLEAQGEMNRLGAPVPGLEKGPLPIF